MNLKHEYPHYIAEFIGTFFLVFLACGAIIIHQIDASRMASFVIPIIFGGAVSIMIYAVGHISGAHFNPAVTLAFWAVKRMPGFRVPAYIAAQTLGAVTAGVIHAWIWQGATHDFGMTVLHVPLSVGLGVEVVLSFLLMFVIISVATDSRAVGELAGLAIGTTVAMCAFVGGPLTGASMNPARSFGPALMAGELSSIWIYILAPIVGAALGALTYEWIRCYKDSDSDHGCC